MRVESGAFGETLVATGPWTNECYEACASRPIREIVLASANGWYATSLAFLRELPIAQIASIRISDEDGSADTPVLEDDSDVACLRTLRQLELRTRCKNPVDLSTLRQLRDCCIIWRAGLDSVAALRDLTELCLSKFAVQDLTLLRSLRKLTSLSIHGSSARTLRGIEALERLAHVHLSSFRKLTGIGELAGLRRLRHLDVQGAKHFKNLDPLRGLALEYLWLTDDGHIESLVPIAEMRTLKEVFFYGDTVIDDGNIAVFEQLANPSVGFANRRHYNRKMSDFT